MSKFTKYLETINPFLIPKDENELKEFANTKKLSNIQNYLKSGKIIPTGGPNEIRKIESRQADKKFITLRSKIVNSDWFKNFLKQVNFKLVKSFDVADINIHFPKADIAIVHNIDKFFKIRINIQTGLCYKWSPSGSKNGWTGAVESLMNGEFAQDLGSESKAKKFILGKFNNWITNYFSKEKKQKAPESFQIKLDNDLIDLKNSIINSSWFKQLIKRNKFKLSQEFFKYKPIEICIMNKELIFSWNLQTSVFRKKPINETWRDAANPQISFPWKQINKKLTESKFREYLENDFFPNI
jgi:hypothetical protein